MGKGKEIVIGSRIGRLVIKELIAPIKTKNKNNRAVRCICDCGKIVDATFHSLGHKKSCGCLMLEKASEMGKRKATHKLTKHPLYQKWADIRTRTGLTKKRWVSDKTKRNYIDKGIKMCNAWKDDFMSFYDWSINNGWRKGLIIDRKNNDRGYSPNNCRYVTQAESNRNTSKNIFYNGLCLQDYCEDNGLPYSTVFARYKYYGFTLKEAINIPIRKRK